MFNSLLSCQDIIYEISTYLYHDEMRNLKLAFPSIILNKDLYSERKEKYKLLIDNSSIDDICDFLVSKPQIDISNAISIGSSEIYGIKVYELYFPVRIFGDCVKKMFYYFNDLFPELNVFKLCESTVDNNGDDDDFVFNNPIQSNIFENATYCHKIYIYRNSSELEKYLINNNIYPSKYDKFFYRSLFKCDYLEKCVRKHITRLTDANFYKNNAYYDIKLRDVEILISYFSEEEKLKLKNSLLELSSNDDYHKSILEML